MCVKWGKGGREGGRERERERERERIQASIQLTIVPLPSVNITMYTVGIMNYSAVVNIVSV